MQQKGFRLLSVLLAAALLIGLITAAPFTASAAGDDTHTIHVTSNLFPDNDLTVSDWSTYENNSGEVFVAVDFMLYAEHKFLVGVELDRLTWDSAVLEYKEAYNHADIGRNPPLNLFPFAIEQGFGAGTYNTRGDTNDGTRGVVGNYSHVSRSKPYAASAYSEDDLPVTVVRAVFRVKDRNAAETTVRCDFEVLSLDDDDTVSPKPRYLPINRGEVNESDKQLGQFTTKIYAKPFMAGHTLRLDSGEIGVNFYMDIRDAALLADINDLKAVMTFGDSNTRFGIREVTATPEYHAQYRLYRVSCPVPCIMMTDTITMRLYGKDGNELFFDTYRVVDYPLNNAGASFMNDTIRRLLCEMLSYGGAAQTYFGYHTNNLASAAIDDINHGWSQQDYSWEPGTVSLTAEDDTSNLRGWTDPTLGLTYLGSTMSTRERVYLNLYFNVTDESVQAYLGDRQLDFRTGTNGRFITIDGISPDKIFDEYTITFKNSDNTVTVDKKYTAISYYFSNTVQSNTNLLAMMNAMYRYSQATGAYVSSKGGA